MIRHHGLGGALKPSLTDYGPRHARCPRCQAWLNRFHDPNLDAGLCHPCRPPGEGGVVVEVKPRQYRRFHVIEGGKAHKRLRRAA